MLVSLLKAPSAVATVGYLAVGLTLPFFAAYKEKYRPFLLNWLMVENIQKEKSLTRDLEHMEVIVDYKHTLSKIGLQ